MNPYTLAITLFLSLGVIVMFGFMLIFQLETRIKRLEQKEKSKTLI